MTAAHSEKIEWKDSVWVVARKQAQYQAHHHRRYVNKYRVKWKYEKRTVENIEEIAENQLISLIFNQLQAVRLSTLKLSDGWSELKTWMQRRNWINTTSKWRVAVQAYTVKPTSLRTASITISLQTYQHNLLVKISFSDSIRRHVLAQMNTVCQKGNS